MIYYLPKKSSNRDEVPHLFLNAKVQGLALPKEA